MTSGGRAKGRKRTLTSQTSLPKSSQNKYEIPINELEGGSNTMGNSKQFVYKRTK